MNAHTPNGFILIELVATLILVGFIGAFVGLFLNTGINGFLASTRNSEAALKAQFALDRISAELRHIKPDPKPAFGTKSITYQNSEPYLPGSRSLQVTDGVSGPGIYLTVGGNTNILLDNLDLSKSDITYQAINDLDNSGDGTKEINFIKVAFVLNNLNKTFEVTIFPRSLITYP